MNFKRRAFHILAALVAMAPCVARAQGACAVAVMDVYSSGATMSSFGVPSVLDVTYRNATAYPIDTAVFAAQLLPSWPYASSPRDLTARQYLAPGASSTAEWNFRSFALQGSTPRRILLKPTVVLFADGSTWTTPLVDQCGYDGPISSRAPTARPKETDTGAIALPKAGLTESDRIMIAAGRASLCSVTSTPKGATIDVDGRVIGTTPLRFILVARPVPREIFVYEDGYGLFHKTVSPDGDPFSIDVILHEEGQKQ